MPRRAITYWSDARHRRWLHAALGTGAGVLLLLLVGRSIPVAELARDLHPQHLWPLAALLGLVLTAQALRAVRWRWLLAPLAPVPLLDAFWINAASGLLNYVLPVRAGEAARVVWLTRRHRVAAGTAVGCMVVDHTFDLGGVIVVLATGTILTATAAARTPGMPALLTALAGALAMFAAIVGCAALGPRLARSPLVPARFSARVTRHALAFRAGTRLAGSPGRATALALASAAAVGLDGLAFAMLFQSLGLAVSIASAIVTQVTLLYAYVLPAAPGYLGSLEAAGTLILSRGLGLGAGAAAGAILLWHLAGATVVLGAGGLGLFMLRGQRGAAAGRLPG